MLLCIFEKISRIEKKYDIVLSNEYLKMNQIIEMILQIC